MRENIKIGLALGSGASRGLAHIGVLQVLDEYGIKPDFIAGSSIGAVIGALYAGGMAPKMMQGIARNLDAKTCYDVCIPKIGFMQGKKIEELMRLLTRGREFSDLDIPLAITATDLIKCKRIIFQDGKVYRAVRASISIPGLFQPVYDQGQVLVDGGVLERVPVNVVREMGAGIVIGVDVGFRGEHSVSGNILEIIMQSLEVMELEILKHTIPQEDIMICPELGNINPMDFDQVDECVEAGRQATFNVLEKLKALIT